MRRVTRNKRYAKQSAAASADNGLILVFGRGTAAIKFRYGAEHRNRGIPAPPLHGELDDWENSLVDDRMNLRQAAACLDLSPSRLKRKIDEDNFGEKAAKIRGQWKIFTSEVVYHVYHDVVPG